MKHLFLPAILIATVTATAQRIEPLKFGDMDHWVERDVKESGIIGGKQKTVYAIGPDAHITQKGDQAYRPQGGSPWATSNVVARVAGVTKTSNAVFPEDRPGHGRCAKLCSQMESCKALGIVNIDVMVAGTMFLGRMLEPIKSTSDPYSKMEMGVPFTSRPTALVYDYAVTMPKEDTRIYSSGFSKKRTLQGHDNPEVVVFLQRRWEDGQGNLYAHRVATAREVLGHDTGWVNGHKLPLRYGDISKQGGFNSSVGLLNGKHAYFARNSRGEMVPVQEVGWDPADAAPTHIIVMFSAGSGEPYVGTPGLTLRVDNVAMAY